MRRNIVYVLIAGLVILLLGSIILNINQKAAINRLNKDLQWQAYKDSVATEFRISEVEILSELIQMEAENPWFEKLGIAIRNSGSSKANGMYIEYLTYKRERYSSIMERLESLIQDEQGHDFLRTIIETLRK